MNIGGVGSVGVTSIHLSEWTLLGVGGVGSNFNLPECVNTGGAGGVRVNLIRKRRSNFNPREYINEHW